MGLLSALAHCHAAGFLHQDVKPGNMLLTNTGTVKLADFGLAAQVTTPHAWLFHQVVTLCYRAPELLLGARRHCAGVDMWAAGCILGELLLGRILFETTSEIGQLSKHIEFCGAPTVATWPVSCPAVWCCAYVVV